MRRRRFEIEGIVQGVGFRPFVFSLARRYALAGWVLNDARGVSIEAQGDEEALGAFARALQREHPPLAVITGFHVEEIAPQEEGEFSILASRDETRRSAQIAPDTWVCPECLAELFDPADRRYRYPFINCTNCGPRYSIVTAVPYDRPSTTMVDFPLCAACLAEYEDPVSRRFHAQPNACVECGPRLSLRDAEGALLPCDDPVMAAVALLRDGKIVAIKGLGGYHLAVDARSGEGVAELRRRKVRDEKPFALMSFDLDDVARYARFDETEARLLSGAERPIVLLRQREEHPLSPLVAPRNRYFGVMLPYTPLHYLLLKDSFTALVMTSGNHSDEPIAFEDGDAQERLGGIADAFLTHDRRIHIRTDDSIARTMSGRPLLLRRSRGYVPRGVLLPRSQPCVLAVGGELKNTVCLTRDDRAYLSHHVGDLKNPETFSSFCRTVDHLRAILDLTPEIVAHDLHPDYDSSRYAEAFPNARKVAVQHHHAHLASCLAEHGTEEDAIGVIFDGIGYGADGRIWGGEFLVGDLTGYRRAGHLAYAAMPGGDAATKEPWRMALSYIYQVYGRDYPALPFLEEIEASAVRIVLQMIEKGFNSPMTSSCGRLFDAVAALCALRTTVSYEGQAALELEMILDPKETGSYRCDLRRDQHGWIVDPSPLIRGAVEDLLEGAPAAVVSARFHRALAQIVAAMCRRLRDEGAPGRVVLSGGVFQNLFLTESASALLRADRFEVLTHSLVPPNDGGLSLGQAAVAARA